MHVWSLQCRHKRVTAHLSIILLGLVMWCSCLAKCWLEQSIQTSCLAPCHARKVVSASNWAYKLGLLSHAF